MNVYGFYNPVTDKSVVVVVTGKGECDRIIVLSEKEGREANRISLAEKDIYYIRIKGKASTIVVEKHGSVLKYTIELRVIGYEPSKEINYTNMLSMLNDLITDISDNLTKMEEELTKAQEDFKNLVKHVATLMANAAPARDFMNHFFALKHAGSPRTSFFTWPPSQFEEITEYLMIRRKYEQLNEELATKLESYYRVLNNTIDRLANIREEFNETKTAFNELANQIRSNIIKLIHLDEMLNEILEKLEHISGEVETIQGEINKLKSILVGIRGISVSLDENHKRLLRRKIPVLRKLSWISNESLYIYFHSFRAGQKIRIVMQCSENGDVREWYYDVRIPSGKKIAIKIPSISRNKQECVLFIIEPGVLYLYPPSFIYRMENTYLDELKNKHEYVASEIRKAITRLNRLETRHDYLLNILIEIKDNIEGAAREIAGLSATEISKVAYDSLVKTFIAKLWAGIYNIDLEPYMTNITAGLLEIMRNSDIWYSLAEALGGISREFAELVKPVYGIEPIEAIEKAKEVVASIGSKTREAKEKLETLREKTRQFRDEAKKQIEKLYSKTIVALIENRKITPPFKFPDNSFLTSLHSILGGTGLKINVRETLKSITTRFGNLDVKLATASSSKGVGDILLFSFKNNRAKNVTACVREGVVMFAHNVDADVREYLPTLSIDGAGKIFSSFVLRKGELEKIDFEIDALKHGVRRWLRRYTVLGIIDEKHEVEPGNAVLEMALRDDKLRLSIFSTRHREGIISARLDYAEIWLLKRYAPPMSWFKGCEITTAGVVQCFKSVPITFSAMGLLIGLDTFLDIPVMGPELEKKFRERFPEIPYEKIEFFYTKQIYIPFAMPPLSIPVPEKEYCYQGDYKAKFTIEVRRCGATAWLKDIYVPLVKIRDKLNDKVFM